MLPKYKQAISRYILIPSKGGCFELTVGGKRLYSKLETGKFPDEQQMVDAVGKALRL